MSKSGNIFIILLLLLSGGTASAQEEYWAREFAPLPNQVITFNGAGDDGSELSFITVYYARESFEPDYWVSEYNIFPGDRQDPDFVPGVSVDYYLNQQGLWARTPFEKSQGMAPGLLLPYKFCEGTAFNGRGGLELKVLSVNASVREQEYSYANCLELLSSEGDQLFYMAETGLVLSRGNNEQWMVKQENLTPEQIRAAYKIR